jgi:hypothetical protein
MRSYASGSVRRGASEIEWWVPLALATGGVIVVLIAWTTILGAEHGPGWGFDFRAYYDAALRLAATGSPYQSQTLNIPFRPGPAGLYLYTPVAALLVVPLTWLGPDSATMTWLLLRLGLLFATCALMPVPRRIKVATLAVSVISAEVLWDLNLGNVSLVVTFLAVVAWRWLDKPMSGLAIAASLCIRPAMGVIWLWWIVRRQWQAVAWTVLGFAAIVLVSLPFLGLDPWIQYASVLRHISHVMGVDRNLDFGSTALSLGLPYSFGVLMLVSGYAVAIGAVVLGLRRDREIGFAVTLMATLLLSPLLWDHYLTNLIIPAALLASRGRPWAIFLPLLGWLPLVFLPLVTMAAMLLPFLAPDRGVRALELSLDQPEPIADVDPSLSGAAGA